MALFLVSLLALSLSMSAVDGLSFMPQCDMYAPTQQCTIADCTFEGKTIPIGSKKKFFGKTCKECECQTDGALRCCRIGYDAFLPNIEGCKIKQLRKCQFTYVKIANERKLCRIGQSPSPYYVANPYFF